MARSRLLTALAGLAASLVVSAAVWWFTGHLLLFLFVPFVPFLFLRRGGTRADRTDRPDGHDPHHRGPAPRECPACGYRTTDADHRYCPRDGTRLEPADRQGPSRRD